MAAVRKLQTGLWHREAQHPEWKPGDEWDERVSSYATDDRARLLLRPLLELPDEHVLATHDGPVDRAALERALA